MPQVRILSWSDERAWTDWSGHAKAQLAGRLRAALPNMPALELKRLTRHVLKRECLVIPLPANAYAASIRHLLESIGAEVQIEDLGA